MSTEHPQLRPGLLDGRITAPDRLVPSTRPSLRLGPLGPVLVGRLRPHVHRHHHHHHPDRPQQPMMSPQPTPTVVGHNHYHQNPARQISVRSMVAPTPIRPVRPRLVSPAPVRPSGPQPQVAPVRLPPNRDRGPAPMVTVINPLLVHRQGADTSATVTPPTAASVVSRPPMPVAPSTRPGPYRPVRPPVHRRADRTQPPPPERHPTAPIGPSGRNEPIDRPFMSNDRGEPGIDIDAITTKVIAALDRRHLSHRERMGRRP